MSSESDKRVIVLGAGPAGLSAAMRLAAKGIPVTVLEKKGSVGGMSGSFRWKGYTLDYGPHTLHVKDPEITGLVKTLYEEDPQELLEGKRNIYVYLKGKMFHYPLSALEVLGRLNPFLTIKAIMEFLMVSLIYKLIYVPEDNFESWGIRRFGKTLYNLCFGAYTEKVWKMPARQMSFRFASEKVRGLDFKTLIKKMFRVRGQTLLTAFWTNWLYPKTGSFDIYNRMKKQIEEEGEKVLLNTRILKINHDNGRITSVEFEVNGTKQNKQCEWLISTIPIKSLAILLHPPPSDFVLYHARKLGYRSLILVYLEIDSEKVHDAHWFYLLDGHFFSNRVSEQRNISPSTIPAGRNILAFEITCRENDHIWNMEDHELLDLVKEDMAKIAFMKGINTLDSRVVRLKDAYEVYDLDFNKHLDVLTDYMRGLPNCIITGRKGLFLQNDIHDSVMMGMDAADLIARRMTAP